MTGKFTGKTFFFVSLGVVGYFCFFILNWFICQFYNDIAILRIIIGFIQELTMLPMLFLIQPGLLVFSIIHCIRERFRLRSWAFWSFLILLISNLFCLGSFFLRIPVK